MIRLSEKWKKELDDLSEKTGVSLDQVSRYIGIDYRNTIGFYYKIPKKRESLIGIGMAFSCDLDTINRWITQYGGKKKLYSKEALSDLVWIYLINANHNDTVSDLNYYRLYDSCRDKVQETYMCLWNEYVQNSKGTADIDSRVEKISFDEGFEGIRAFVAENMDSFKTAYARPRTMLARYVNAILAAYTRANDGKETPINYLRGFLDDSMINYITGDHESINVIDMTSRDRVINMKAVPKLKRTHIAICLALGMCTGEINDYLEMMGYYPLEPSDKDECNLLELLDVWEIEHPKACLFKKLNLGRQEYADYKGNLSGKDELEAVSEMLMLRSDLRYESLKTGEEFPYMRD